MSDYIYRIDTLKGIKRIEGDAFRGKKWVQGTGYPHALMKGAPLPATDANYIVCFFSTLEKAEESLKRDYEYFKPSYILRCRKDALATARFNESWDDGFAEGDAYLFWIRETVTATNTELSNAGIPLTNFEIQVAQQWIPFTHHLQQLAS